MNGFKSAILVLAAVLILGGGYFLAKNLNQSDSVSLTRGLPAQTAATKILEADNAGGIEAETAAGDYFSARGRKDRASLLAFGDMMLDRYIKKTIDKYGADYSFQNIKPALAGNDLTLANLEGSFTDFAPNIAGPNMTSFTFDPKLIPAIKTLGFNILSQANNHTQDYGLAGLAQSQTYLKNNGIEYFGTFANDGKISAIEDINGIKIGFVGYDEFGENFDGVIAEIKNLKPQVDHVVAMPHWGIEYKTNNSSGQQAKARQFIDAGADLVLGGHPHVVQPLEVYKGRLIFYSLGNFVFDQIFSQDVQRGLAVGAIFAKDSITCYLMPTQNKKFIVSFATVGAKAAILQDLSDRSTASDDFKTQIVQGKIEIKTTD